MPTDFERELVSRAKTFKVKRQGRAGANLVTFIEHIAKDPDSDCWVWTGSTTSNGTGVTNGYSARSLSHEFFNGVDSTGKHVRATCHNPKCLNPDHLYIPDLDGVFFEQTVAMREASEVTDAETAHAAMDAILVEIVRKHGYGEVADIFEQAEKWYG